jgi:hypothetical protein
MNRLLDWANAGEPISVDVDALWQKAMAEGRDVSVRVKRSLTSNMPKVSSGTGELAIISAWARGKVKKG